jgi:hypothetical protein
MSSRALFAVSVGIATLLALGFGGPAEARVTSDSGYTKAQTYSTALRFLRVDRGYEVLERDADAAYLIFRYETPGQAKSELTGTVEVVETGEKVRIFVQIPRMPEYHERVLRDGLMRKLFEEYGAPPVRRKEEAAPPDAGSDAEARAESFGGHAE